MKQTSKQIKEQQKIEVKIISKGSREAKIHGQSNILLKSETSKQARKHAQEPRVIDQDANVPVLTCSAPVKLINSMQSCIHPFHSFIWLRFNQVVCNRHKYIASFLHVQKTNAEVDFLKVCSYRLFGTKDQVHHEKKFKETLFR